MAVGSEVLWVIGYRMGDSAKLTNDTKNILKVNLEALNYKLSENISVGLTGSYVLDVKPGDFDYYTVGLNFKWAF